MQPKNNESLTRRFYDRISHVYDTIADGGEHKARERGLELLAVGSGESVLEIGYGTGHSIVALAESVGDTGHVTGIDISSGMQQVSQKRVNESSCADRVELLVSEAPPLPMGDKIFDVVTLSFTLELFPIADIPAVLTEIRRVLKPTGRLGVVSMATVRDGEGESPLEKTYKWMHTHFPHIVDCQPIDAERLVTESGFTLTKNERFDLFTMPVAILVANRTQI
ncbi:class I SAM-dependent methyltransferase [Stieleria magnilauensis]|uniref:Demethylmenaquinone methyltransferase n=1 Tax=Stieleria magnilauensis TaxID=2527963 RepID=A0ABX5XUK3_9BACT|nr:Demethylmenaquinone methyltransferase [Planctomycetes bacterium TBK1r]